MRWRFHVAWVLASTSVAASLAVRGAGAQEQTAPETVASETVASETVASETVASKTGGSEHGRVARSRVEKRASSSRRRQAREAHPAATLDDSSVVSSRSIGRHNAGRL